MYDLKAFDDNWIITKDLEEDDMKVALEISEFMISGTKPKDVFARQLARIMPKPIHTSFIEAMLFSGTDIEIIAEKSDLPQKLLHLYKTLFFDTDEFLGRLDKVEYFQGLLTDNKPGDGEHTKGMLFQSSFAYGWKYVATKFHLDVSQEFGTQLMELMAREAFYKWNDDTLEGKNSKSFFRDTKDVISIVDSTVKAQDGASDEKSLGLMQSMMDMNEEFSEEPKVLIMNLFDTSREMFTNPDAVIDQQKVIEHKKD